MVGTYSTIPDLNWAVVAQRSLDNAREDAGVKELNAQALKFVLVVTFAALILGYLFAVGISTPIRALAASTRAISRGEFHQRTPVQGAAEISELAETFNSMAGNIEEFIEQLKQAAAENRDLFLGSIRMLAAAIDEKDPYTRGHSGRVAKYSMIIGQQLGLPAAELDKLRISALLHDVGKIGVDDRVLKKPGMLTPEEFDLMKQHPSKGANIMRPVAQLKEMLPGIELHHEHMDGGGYPHGLHGDEIPDDGSHHRRGRYARRHDDQPAVPIGDGSRVRHGPHSLAGGHEIRPRRRGCPRPRRPRGQTPPKRHSGRRSDAAFRFSSASIPSASETPLFLLLE